MRDGMVKSIIDSLNAPFEQFYLDSWAIIPYFIWKLKGKKEPQVIDYLKRVVVKKVVSDLVKIETNNIIRKRYNKDITNKMWQDCFNYLNIACIGNPLNLSPSTPDEFDDAHLATARNLNNCIIITDDIDFVEKNPDIVWKYGKIRHIHSDT